jgi:hypothetical protein
MLSQTVLRTALWLSLGLWVGSWAFFAFVVSRIAFQILPGNVAGDLAGSLLEILHFGGAVAALVAAGAAVALGRRGLLVGLPVVLALICLFSELWLSPQVELVRPSVLGAASTVVTAERFRIYHGLSLGLFMGVHFASILLVVLHARRDARDARLLARAAG